MPRLPSLNPNDRLNFAISPELKARIAIILFSEVEGRIPKGAWQGFIEARLREWLQWRQHPLEQFGFPPGYFITGPAEMTQAVIERLKGNECDS
jgi:hypothetical protein